MRELLVFVGAAACLGLVNLLQAIHYAGAGFDAQLVWRAFVSVLPACVLITGADHWRRKRNAARRKPSTDA